nr:MAG TPA: hypothetical protein [Caudoviricetes sp.]
MTNNHTFETSSIHSVASICTCLPSFSYLSSRVRSDFCM